MGEECCCLGCVIFIFLVQRLVLLLVCPCILFAYTTLSPCIPYLTSSLTPHTERRKEKAKNESEAGAASASTPSASVDAAHPDDGTVSGVDGDNARADGAGTDGGGPGPDGDNAPGTNKADGTRDAHPPAQKYRLTEAMKVIVWQLVMLSNECCRLENEKK